MNKIYRNALYYYNIKANVFDIEKKNIKNNFI